VFLSLLGLVLGLARAAFQPSEWLPGSPRSCPPADAVAQRARNGRYLERQRLWRSGRSWPDDAGWRPSDPLPSVASGSLWSPRRSPKCGHCAGWNSSSVSGTGDPRSAGEITISVSTNAKGIVPASFMWVKNSPRMNGLPATCCWWA